MPQHQSKEEEDEETAMAARPRFVLSISRIVPHMPGTCSAVWHSLAGVSEVRLSSRS